MLCMVIGVLMIFSIDGFVVMDCINWLCCNQYSFRFSMVKSLRSV